LIATNFCAQTDYVHVKRPVQNVKVFICIVHR